MNKKEVNFIGKMIIDELLELFATVSSHEEAKQTMKDMIDNAKNVPQSFKKGTDQCAEQADALVDIYYYSLNAACKKGWNLSQIFNIPSFPVDTHIHRTMYRWGLSSGKNVKTTERDAKRLFPKQLWNKLHLQMIYYAREFSPARGWDLDNDHITSTIGRKSILKKLKK